MKLTQRTLSTVNYVIRNGLKMRESFDFNNIEQNSWYARHMYSSMIKMQARLRQLDCLIEVRDARIPISSTNPDFYARLTAIKPVVVVFSKSDLSDTRHREKLIHYCNQKPEINRVVFANLKGGTGVKNIIPAICESISDNSKFNRSVSTELNVMVIGVPNVGKSSLINQLRAKVLHRGKATATGKNPGVTRSLLERIKVCHQPLMYLYDTPGIIMPKITNNEAGLKLAATAAVGKDFIDERIVADYILFRLNEMGNHSYVDILKLPRPTDDINEIVTYIAKTESRIKNVRLGNNLVQKLDLSYSTAQFLKNFRDGNYGKLMLDEIEDC